MKICVVGLGYIGLPTATLAALAGHKVVGVDTNPSVVEALNNGTAHIQEPGLDELVRKVVLAGRLTAQANVPDADVYIVAVPTPIKDDKTADLSYVKAAAYSVTPHIQEGSLFIVESTIPPGCTEELIIPILEESELRAGIDFYVAHCPERVIPGNVLHELVHNDRIVGGINPASANRARAFYATFVKGGIFTTGLKEAELTKLAENAYRDVNIAFANELAGICESLGVDVWEVIKMANRHPRVNILKPGPGVGGHCIAVDPWFLVESCPDCTRLISAARKVNDDRPARIAQQVAEMLARCDVDVPRVACLGMTYKADVDDMRCSPSLDVVAELERLGCEVRISDPYANANGKHECVSVEEAVSGADALVLLVDHKQYLNFDLESLTKLMRHPVIVDTRGAWRDTPELEMMVAPEAFVRDTIRTEYFEPSGETKAAVPMP